MVPYLTFDIFEKTGAVKALYTPMGVGRWKMTDDESIVNYNNLGEEFEITAQQMVRTKQLHTNGVRIITRENAGEGILRPVTEEGFDGMITNEKKLMLCTVEADCTPVYLYDPVNQAVAMLHSGWRGTAGRITTNAINLMQKTYGTDPSTLLAAIGPCICKDCYEVTDDLIPPFLEYFEKEDVDRFFTPKPNGRYWLDLKEAVRTTLLLSGVLPDNIEDSGYCTFHDNKFHSWRRDADPDVRMLTAIMIV